MAFRRRGSFAKTLRSLEPEYTDYAADQGTAALERNQWFFEIAWEVANKGESPICLYCHGNELLPWKHGKLV